MALWYPMAMALNKGHKVTTNARKPRHSQEHGHLTKHTKVVQVGEGQGPRVVWFAPQEGLAQEEELSGVPAARRRGDQLLRSEPPPHSVHKHLTGKKGRNIITVSSR